MAINVDSLLEVTLVGHMFAQTCMNVFQYEVAAKVGDPTPSEWGAAWWAHVKTTVRPLVTAYHLSAFEEVRIRELDDPTGEFGVYAVPAGEQAGTGTTTSNEQLPPYVTSAVKLTVATRATRPGQKRFSGLGEAWVQGANLTSTYIALLNSAMGVLSVNMTLGAPAAGSQLDPVVVRKDRATGLPLSSQPITGYVINPYASSQVSRKVGRGI
jgi:hypothetical protein